MDLLEKYYFVYVKICKSVYGIKQSSRITFDRLVKLLNPHGYYPLRSNPGIRYQKTLPTKFALCLNYLLNKYTNPAHDHHFVNDGVYPKMSPTI